MKRAIKTIIESKPTVEGAGVKLERVFGSPEVPLFDPFLLLDHFGSEQAEDYLKGFPWHPHRGIETVTYMVAGEVEHGDSMGNHGRIRSGELQWMTAGSGIIHKEMPKRYEGAMQGFQLWVNLPAAEKMIPPKYRGIAKEQIPVLNRDGVQIKVIAGYIDDVEGPVQDLVVDTEYFEVEMTGSEVFEHPTDRSHNAFIYAIDGAGYCGDLSIKAKHCGIFSEGDLIQIRTTHHFRFLLISGQPLKEPVAWGGPVVMNTEEELTTAFQELEEGTFIKTGRKVRPSSTFYQN